MKPTSLRLFALPSLAGAFVVVLLMASATDSIALSGNWTVDANGNWSTLLNWTSIVAPGTAAGDTVGLTYDLTAARTITMDTTSRTMGTLNIGDPGSSYFAYTLTNSGGAILTFNNNGSTANLVKGVSTATDIIALPIVLSDDLSITNGTGLTLSKEISGAKNITKNGAGTLTFSGTNTYDGVTTINGGFLKLQNASGLGSTNGGTVVANGASLDVLGGYTMAEPLNLNGDGASSVGALRNLNPVSLTWNELITLASSSRINCQGFGGTLTLGGATGGITGSGFDLTFGASASSGDVVMNRPITLGTGNLINIGNGIITLNTTNTFNGLTISFGTVKLGVSDVIPDTSIVTNNATFSMQGFNETIGGLSGTGSVTGSGANILTNNVASGSLTFSGVMGAGTFTKTGAGTQILSGINTYGATVISAGTLQIGSGSTNGILGTGNVTNNATLVFNRSDALTSTNIISGTGALTKSGTGTLTVSAANTYSGATVINDGILKLGNSSALGSTNGSTFVTNNGTLDVNGIAFATPAELITVSGTGLSSTGAVINSGAVQQSAIRYLTLSSNASIGAWFNRWDVRGPGPNGALNGNLNLNGYTLTKLGTGVVSVVELMMTNGGSIVIDAGTLLMARVQTDASGSITITNNAILSFQNNILGSIVKPIIANGTNSTLQISTAAFTLGSSVTNLTGLTVDASADLTMTNVISGPGALVKVSSAALTLSGINTYTGPTAVSNGTLVV
ncbi:MAG: hypothetical protein JWM68_822, partial [Verrucomicrobiales bacterium]|nr:hypothetical protein [Verrucomicrobiales bacterium]